MALPVTISGVSTNAAPVGPFQILAGTTYDIAQDLTTSAITNATSTTTTLASFGCQSFTAASSFSLTAAEFYAVGGGGFAVTINSGTAEIRTGSPTGSLVGTSDTLTGYAIAASGSTKVRFTFSSSVALTSGTVYYVVLNLTLNSNNGIGWLGNGSDTYAGGTGYSPASTAAGLVARVTAPFDYAMQLYASGTVASDAYYFFCEIVSNSTTLAAYKATAPDTSWSSVATHLSHFTGSGGARTAGYQVGKIIHLVSGSTVSGSGTTDYRYIQFDMSTEAFSNYETYATSASTAGQTGLAQLGNSLVVRSTGEVVVFFNGAQTKTGGTQRARVYYSRRTAVNTWSAPVEVDAGTSVDNVAPRAVLGAADRVQFYFLAGGSGSRRALSSANALQTANAALSALFSGAIPNATSYNNAGTQKLVSFWPSTSSQVDYGNDANTLTDTIVTPSQFANAALGRLFVDNTDVYCLFGNNLTNDLYVSESSDDGATWSAATLVFAGAVSSVEASLSFDGDIYTRGNNVVIPYIVNDNGTLKYNEYTVRTLAVQNPFALDDFSFYRTFGFRTQGQFAQPVDALNVNLFTNPLPFVTTDRPRVVQVPLVGPPQSLPLNINLFTNPIPFAQYHWPATRRILPPPTPPPSRDIKIYSEVPFNQDDWSFAFGRKYLSPVQPYNMALLAVLAQNPFVPVDWSKISEVFAAPAQAMPLNINLFTNPIPFAQFDWSMPVRFRVSTQDQVPYNLSLLGIQVTAPFYQTDWQSARTITRSAPDMPAPNVVLLNLLSTPFSKTDWATTSRVRYAPQDPVPANTNLFPNPYPFAQYDWSKPQQSPNWQPSRSSDFNPNLSAIPIPPPFVPVDWSKPFRVPGLPPGSGPLNINVFTNPLPFASSVPGFSRTVPSAQPGQSYPNLPMLYAMPFFPVDYSAPVRARISPLPVWSSGFSLSLSIPPFSQSYWPGLRPVRLAQTQVQGLNPNLAIIQVIPRPFAQYDWPLVQSVRSLLPRTVPYLVKRSFVPYQIISATLDDRSNAVTGDRSMVLDAEDRSASATDDRTTAATPIDTTAKTKE